MLKQFKELRKEFAVVHNDDHFGINQILFFDKSFSFQEIRAKMRLSIQNKIIILLLIYSERIQIIHSIINYIRNSKCFDEHIPKKFTKKMTAVKLQAVQ